MQAWTKDGLYMIRGALIGTTEAKNLFIRHFLVDAWHSGYIDNEFAFITRRHEKIILHNNAGQEKFRTIIPSYVSNKHIYFALIDTSSEESAMATRNLIKEYINEDNAKLWVVPVLPAGQASNAIAASLNKEFEHVAAPVHLDNYDRVINAFHQAIDECISIFWLKSIDTISLKRLIKLIYDEKYIFYPSPDPEVINTLLASCDKEKNILSRDVNSIINEGLSSSKADPKTVSFLQYLKMALQNDFPINSAFLELLERGISKTPKIPSIKVFEEALYYFAVQTGNIKMITAMASENPLFLNMYFAGKTALMHAVEANKIELAEHLIHMGADTHILDAEGRSLFEILMAGENPKTICSLVMSMLSAGMGVDMRSPSGKTPLMIAWYANNLDLVNRLLAVGADIYARDNEGFSIIAKILQYGDSEKIRSITEYIISSGNINGQDSSGKTALMMAVESNNVTCVEQLLLADADVTIADKDLNTPLITAAKEANAAMISLLLISSLRYGMFYHFNKDGLDALGILDAEIMRRGRTEKLIAARNALIKPCAPLNSASSASEPPVPRSVTIFKEAAWRGRKHAMASYVAERRR